MATDLWNLWEICQPPVCKTKQLLQRKEIQKLNQDLFDILNTLKSSHILNKEAALLSKVLYKYKRSHRHEKGMQYLSMVYQCLKRYTRLNLYDIVNGYKKTLPGKFSFNDTHAYLPTKQMLQWVLLRLQAFSKLFLRIFNLSKAAGTYIYNKLCLGWSVKTGFFIYGVCARLLILSQFMVVKSIEWYNTLYKYLPIFQLTCEFLPEYEFPPDLKIWLGDIDLLVPPKKSHIDKVFEMIDLVDNDDDECVNDEIRIIHENFFKSFLKPKEITIDSDVEEITTDKKDVESEVLIVKKVKVSCDADEDLGVPVKKKMKKDLHNQFTSKQKWKRNKKKNYIKPN